ncbi:MAG: hypothetical protein AAB490_01670 [Patescibacteria group bacterium]
MKLYQSKMGRRLALVYLVVSITLILGCGDNNSLGCSYAGIMIFPLAVLIPPVTTEIPDIYNKLALIILVLIHAEVIYLIVFVIEKLMRRMRLPRSKVGWYFVVVYLFLYFISYILDETIFRRNYDGTFWGYSAREAFTFWFLIINSLFTESIQRDFRQSIQPLGFIFSLGTVYFIGAYIEKFRKPQVREEER